MEKYIGKDIETNEYPRFRKATKKLLPKAIAFLLFTFGDPTVNYPNTVMIVGGGFGFAIFFT